MSRCDLVGDMLHRLKTADEHRAGGSAGWVHVVAPERRAALRACAERGWARVWEGEGQDAGILLGAITADGRRASC